MRVTNIFVSYSTCQSRSSFKSNWLLLGESSSHDVTSKAHHQGELQEGALTDKGKGILNMASSSFSFSRRRSDWWLILLLASMLFHTKTIFDTLMSSSLDHRKAHSKVCLLLRCDTRWRVLLTPSYSLLYDRRLFQARIISTRRIPHGTSESSLPYKDLPPKYWYVQLV